MLGGEIKVVMTLDNNDFTIKTMKAEQTLSELKRAVEQTGKSTEALDKHFNGLGGRFRDVIQTASMLRYALHDVHDIFMALPGAILKSSGEFEKLQKLMEGMSKETTKVARQAEALANVKFVFNLAQTAPFEVKALTDAFVKMKSGGLDPTKGSMDALVNSVAKFGGTTDTLHRASIAIQQMAGKGVVSMEELRQQLGEAVPNAINLMAEGAGMSVAAFAKKVGDGTVQAGMALQNMFTVMTIENAGAAQEMMNSWTGMLSLLKTKFEIFKADAGKAGLFDEAKKGLQDIIDAFDTMEAKSLAFDIGRGLGEAVIAIRNLIDFFREYGDEIKTVGTLFLLYFAANKMRDIGSGIQSLYSARRAAYAEEIAAQQDATNRKVAAMNIEMAQRKALIDQINAQATAQFRLAQSFQGVAAKSAADLAEAQRVAGGRGAYSPEAFGQIAGRAAQDAAAVDAARDRGAALANQARELERLQSAQERVTDAIRNGTTASRADTLIIQQANEERRKATKALTDKAEATAKATTNIGLMGRAMAGLNTVVGLFGGWINIAIMTLGFLATKLQEVLSFWDRVQEAVDRTKQGIVSKEDPATINEALKRADTEVAGLEKVTSDPKRRRVTDAEIADAQKKGRTGLAESLRAEQQLFDQQNEALRVAIEKRDNLRRVAQSQVNIKSKSELDQQVNFERRQLQDANNTLFRGATDEINVIRSEIAAAQQKLIDDANKTGKEVSSKALDEVAKSGLVRITKIQQDVIAKSLTNLRKVKTDTEEALKTASPEQAKVLRARLTALGDEQEGLIAKAVQLKKDAENLGKSSNVVKPKEKKPLMPPLKEEPLVRLAEHLEAAVEVARAKLASTAAGARDVEALRNEIMIGVLGDMASGKFDTTFVDEEGKKRVQEFVGGKDERKEYVKRFTEYLASGKTDIEEFIRSLEGLKDKTKIIEIVRQMTAELVLGQQQKALSSAQDEEIKTLQDLNAARVAYASEGLAKESAGVSELEKKFAELRKNLKAGTDDFKMFDDAREQAFRNLGMTNALKFAASGKDQLRQAMDAQSGQFADSGTVARQKFEARKKQIEAQYEAEKSAINRNIADEIKRVEILKTLDQGRADQLRAIAIDLEMALKTPLDRLLAQWQNTTDAMNQLTANWANGFMDQLLGWMTGAKFEWRKFTAGMARDLLAVFVKKNAGDFIGSMFGDIGTKLGGMLGLGGGGERGKTPDTPMYVQDVSLGGVKNPASSVYDEMKSKMSDMWDKVKEGFSGVWDTVKGAAGSLFDSLSSGLGSLWDSISGIFSGGGGGDLMSGVMSLFGFANGGVMSGLGPKSLTRYASGGVANSPQLALFGEGSMPEAYVPLPDGRSIPVSFTGGNTTNTGGVQINIIVNNDGVSTKSNGEDAETWMKLAGRVRSVVQEEMVTQQRPGGLLYNK